MQNEIIVLQKSQLKSIIYDTVLNVLEDFSKKQKIKEIMNLKEAATYLRISPVTLNRRKDEGVIPFSKLGRGGRIIFHKKDLDEYSNLSKSTATYPATKMST